MKKITIVFAICILLIFIIGTHSMISAQKQRPGVTVECQTPTQEDLDCTVNLAVGKNGFYVPTDEEGCDVGSPQGCKFPATITAIESVPNPDRPGRFLPLRNALGQILVSIHVKRPAFKGGSFDKDKVPFTDGCKGCFRTIQSPDLVGF